MKKPLLLFILVIVPIAGWFIYQNISAPISFVSPFIFQNTQKVASAKTSALTDFSLNIKTDIPPVISAKSALVVDMSKKEIIFQKNPDFKQPIASLQKIITAMVVLDNKTPTDIIEVSANASGKEPDSMGLYPGEKLTVEQLLYGLILVSGNDSATALAEGVSGTEKAFSNLMNNKMSDFGLEDSHFLNASGLENDGDQYSTAHDLLVVSHHFLNDYPLLKKIAATQVHTISEIINETQNHKNFYLQNTSPTANLPGYLGIKPGYTELAGRCLITLINHENSDYLVIVTGSEDRRGDTIALLDFVTKGSFSLPSN